MASEPEIHFANLWIAVGGEESGLPLVPELKWHPTRKWRADFALPTRGVLIEIEGGVHSGGRHSRGAGFTADAQKYLEATLSGWHVIRLVPSQLNLSTTERLHSWINALPTKPPASPAPSSKTKDGPDSSSHGLPPGRKPSRKT